MHTRRIRPDDGPLLRSIRLRALEGAPDAFGTTLAEALAYPEDAWDHRATECAASETTALFFVEDEGGAVGMAGGSFEDDDPAPALISMWVEPPARGHGGGEALIEAVTAWAREQGAARLHLWVKPDRLDYRVHTALRRPQDPREVVEVFADRQVGVDGRRLRHVADTPAERRRPCRDAEDLDRPTIHDLHADDRAHQRALPAAAGPKQSGHGTAGDIDGEVGQHEASAARDPQVSDHDRR